MSTGWENWSRSESCSPADLHFARSVDDARAVVAGATATGRRVRVAGNGHSHYRLVPTDDVILDLSGLSGVIDVDAEHGTARIWAGSIIATVGRPLLEAGVGLLNQGDIDRQAIGGAVATGTHGTGRGLQSLSAAVRALRLIDPSGELVDLDAASTPDRFAAAQLSLGAHGVVTEVELAVRPAYRLADRVDVVDWAAVRAGIAASTDEHRHSELFWYPPTDQAMWKRIDETDLDPRWPIGEEGDRVGWSFEVLPSHRPRLHTEMEYAVPLDGSLACLDEIRAMIRRRFSDLQWPVEYRVVAADDVWLSPAHGREVATISLHQGHGLPAEELFRAAEEVFRRHDGRPHWGKVHFLDGSDLAAVHPRWDDWWAVRDSVDPTGTFLNERMASWR